MEEEHPRSGRPLLDGSARRWAGTVLACCVVLVAVLGALFAHQAPPAWIDRVVDDRIIAWLGGHGQLLSWLAYPAAVPRLVIMVGAWTLGCVVAIAVIGLRWHYFTDTVAGAAVGTGTVCGLALILDLPVIGRRLTWGRPTDQV